MTRWFENFFKFAEDFNMKRKECDKSSAIFLGFAIRFCRSFKKRKKSEFDDHFISGNTVWAGKPIQLKPNFTMICPK